MPHSRLRIVGPHSYWDAEPSPYYPALRERCAANPRIELRGPTYDDRELAAVYRDAAVSVVPSVFPEALGLTSLEAQASGVPVVVSDAGGFPKPFDAGRSGLVFENRNAGQLGEAVLSIISNDERRRTMGAAAREWVMRTFSWDVIAAELEQHLRRGAGAMKVALRDDDTSYFTEPGSSRGGVSRRVGSHSRSASPSCRTRRASSTRPIPEKYWDADRAFPLEENAPLVASLREHLKAGPRHDRAARLHARGFSRTATSSRPRPTSRAASRADRRISKRVLDTRIRVFVPPHNALSKRGLAAVGAAGLNLLGSFLSFRPSLRPWDCAHARQLVAGQAVSRQDRPHAKPIAWCILTCCAIASMPSSAVTA